MAATQKKNQQEAPAPQVEARIDRMEDGDYPPERYFPFFGSFLCGHILKHIIPPKRNI